MTYSGQCIGGPYDGKEVKSESQTLELVKYPPVPHYQMEEQTRNVQPEKLGLYRWTSVFVWEPNEPPAADVLPMASLPTPVEDQA